MTREYGSTIPMPFIMRKITAGHYHQRRECVQVLAENEKVVESLWQGGTLSTPARTRFVRYSRWWNSATPTLAILYYGTRRAWEHCPGRDKRAKLRSRQRKKKRLYLHRRCWLPGNDHQSRRALDNDVTISARTAAISVTRCYGWCCYSTHVHWAGDASEKIKHKLDDLYSYARMSRARQSDDVVAMYKNTY